MFVVYSTNTELAISRAIGLGPPNNSINQFVHIPTVKLGFLHYRNVQFWIPSKERFYLFYIRKMPNSRFHYHKKIA